MAAPDYIEILREEPSPFFWGGLISTVGLIGTAISIARGEATEPRYGHKRRMIALAGMIIFGLGFVGSAALYFWPMRPTDDAPYLARLAALGWTIKPSQRGIQFEVSSRPLPPMKESADLFRQLQQPFNLLFQSVTGLEGLHYLSDIEGCTRIEINAGEFTDISELRGFSHLPSLGISQVPLNGVGLVDPSALSSLTNLRELNLNNTKVRSLTFLADLTKLKSLNIGQTLVADLSPISALTSLESLDVRGTPAEYLRPIGQDQRLTELSVGGEQIPSLVNLTHINSLKKLTIIEQRSFDLSAVGKLVNLESVFIWGPSQLDVSPLHNLTKLRELSIVGFGLATGVPTAVTGIEAIGDLMELRLLVLGQVQITNIGFVSKLSNLNQLNLSHVPIQSIEPVRALKSLEKINLMGIPVVDISVVLDLPALSELTIMRTPAREDVLTAIERRGVKVNRF